MNEYDSARMYDAARDSGHERADSEDDADVLLLNTCSIRESPRKVFHQLGRWQKQTDRLIWSSV